MGSLTEHELRSAVKATVGMLAAEIELWDVAHSHTGSLGRAPPPAGRENHALPTADRRRPAGRKKRQLIHLSRATSSLAMRHQGCMRQHEYTSGPANSTHNDSKWFLISAMTTGS